MTAQHTHSVGFLYNILYRLRSITRIPDPKDTAAGVKFLKSICYPNMNRFIDDNQEMGKHKT